MCNWFGGVVQGGWPAGALEGGFGWRREGRRRPGNRSSPGRTSCPDGGAGHPWPAWPRSPGRRLPGGFAWLRLAGTQRACEALCNGSCAQRRSIQRPPSPRLRSGGSFLAAEAMRVRYGRRRRGSRVKPAMDGRRRRQGRTPCRRKSDSPAADFPRATTRSRSRRNAAKSRALTGASRLPLPRSGRGLKYRRFPLPFPSPGKRGLPPAGRAGPTPSRGSCPSRAGTTRGSRPCRRPCRRWCETAGRCR